MQPVVILLVSGVIMFSVIGGLSLLAHYYTLNGIKSKTVGDGQHGTARFATKKEIEETYVEVAYEPEKWRKGENLPTAQGLVLGSIERAGKLYALVDTGDVHCLMIGAAGVGKTAHFLYPNIEYACACGMSFLTTDTKSATNTKKRDDFNAMIKDALDGKIDMILTKSVSRFARNTVDFLLTIRKLKEKNVAVVFEKEGVNTLDGTGEILITILSSLAQEESRNISENTRWGVVRRFENGKMIVNHNKFMGYTKNENGDLVIVPEEAEIVRLIFRLYLEGYSAKKISQYLEENGIKTATGQDKWHDSVIFKMLRNEKYMGDALLQKTYTVDFMTKKKVINKGIVPQYYVEDDHEPIIPKKLFYRVQEELARRASMNKSAVTRKKNQKSKFSSEYALTGLLLCGDCGQEYRRVTWSRNGKKKIVWRCSNRLTNGTKNCKKSESLEEGALNRAVMEAINRITRGDGDFVGAFRQNVIRVIGSYGGEQEPDEYDEKVKEKEEEMVALIAENARVGSYTDEFDERYRRIAEEINTLKEEQIEARRKKKLADSYEQRLKDMDSFLEKQTCQIPEFDNDLVRRLIASIKVVSAEKLIIQFQSGIVTEQEIRYE